jgi:hypothetical protein
MTKASNKLLTIVLLVLFSLLNTLHYEIYHSSLPECVKANEKKGQLVGQYPSSSISASYSEIPCPFCMGLDITYTPVVQASIGQIQEELDLLVSSFTSFNAYHLYSERAPPSL